MSWAHSLTRKAPSYGGILIPGSLRLQLINRVFTYLMCSCTNLLEQKKYVYIKTLSPTGLAWYIVKEAVTSCENAPLLA